MLPANYKWAAIDHNSSCNFSELSYIMPLKGNPSFTFTSTYTASFLFFSTRFFLPVHRNLFRWKICQIWSACLAGWLTGWMA